MPEQSTIDNLFNNWLEKNNQIRNVILVTSYGPALNKDQLHQILMQAFQAGFNAKLKYSAEENLQK